MDLNYSLKPELIEISQWHVNFACCQRYPIKIDHTYYVCSTHLLCTLHDFLNISIFRCFFFIQINDQFAEYFIFCKLSQKTPSSMALRFRAKIHEHLFIYAAKPSLFQISHQFTNESNCMCDNHKWWLCVNMQFVKCENPTFIWWFNKKKQQHQQNKRKWKKKKKKTRFLWSHAKQSKFEFPSVVTSPMEWTTTYEYLWQKVLAVTWAMSRQRIMTLKKRVRSRYCCCRCCSKT